MAIFAQDSFTEATGIGSPEIVDLVNHISDLGHGWTGVEQPKVIVDSDVLNSSAGSGAFNYCTYDTTPPSANYRVEAGITVENTDNFKSAGVLARITSAGGDSGYSAELDNNDAVVRLVRIDAGARTNLGSDHSIDVGTLPVTYNVAIEVSGTTLKLFVDDVEVDSVTDTNYQSAGFAGVCLRSASVNYTAPSIDNFIAETLAAVAGPTITGPDSTTEGAVTVSAGTDLDTVTTFSLVSGSYSIAQTIDSATSTTLNYVAESGVNLCAPGTPVSGVPLEATISAAGVTPYVVQQKADDGTNPPATRNITLNGEATHEVVQVMISTSNTTDGESVLASSIIAVEDDMQYYAPKAVNGMNITWAADGTFTTDADQTETITVGYFSPATGNWSCITLTIKDTSIIAVGMVTAMVSDMVSNMVEEM